MIILEGTFIHIPVVAVMQAPAYFSHPYEFNPDNFKEKNNSYAFLAFGLGPRNCIGSRLAFLQVKMALIHLISNYIIEPGKEFPKHINIDNLSLTAKIKGDVMIKFIDILII